MTKLEIAGITLDTKAIPNLLEGVVNKVPENASLSEKLSIVTSFLEENLINGLVNKDMPDDVRSELLTQSRTIDQILKTRWGYCTEYAATAAFLLAMMKVRTKVQFGRNGEVKHRYLDIFNDKTGKWEIYDPLARLTGKARGNNATQFESVFYRHSETLKDNLE